MHPIIPDDVATNLSSKRTDHRNRVLDLLMANTRKHLETRPVDLSDHQARHVYDDVLTIRLAEYVSARLLAFELVGVQPIAVRSERHVDALDAAAEVGMAYMVVVSTKPEGPQGLKIKVIKSVVEATTTNLTARWKFGDEFEDEAVAGLGDLILKQMDRELLDRIRATAGTTNSYPKEVPPP